MSTPYPYPTDITDAQWQRLHPFLPSRRWRLGGPGRPLRNLRLVLKGRAIGYDAGKRVKRRKYHLLVDSQGSILPCKVIAAHVFDADGLKALRYC